MYKWQITSHELTRFDNDDMEQGMGFLIDEFFQTSPDFVFVLSPEGKILRANQTVRDELQWRPTDYEGKNLFDFVHPDDRVESQQVLLNGNVASKSNMRCRIFSRDGNYRWILWSARHCGESQSVMVTGKDISEMMREMTLMSKTQSAAKIGGWELDLITEKLYWTEETKRIHEVDPATFKPELSTAINFYDESSRPLISAAVDNGVKTGQGWDLELKIITAKGNEKWVRAIGHCEMQSNKVIKLYGSFQDVTLIYEQEKKSRHYHERLRLALSAAHLGIWEWDIRSNQLIWEQKVFEIFGITQQEFDGSFESLRKLIYPEDWAALMENVRMAISGESFDRFYRINLRIKLNNGRTQWVSGQGKVVLDKSGKPIRLLGVVANISEQKQLEEQFLQSQKMESIGLLAGGIAHDFNNMLSVILGHAEVILNAKETSYMYGENIEKIWKAAQRAATLTRRLLTFSRQEVFSTSIIDLNSVVQEAELILARLIGEDINLKVDLSSRPELINSDSNQIMQVIMNLVVNARDAMPQGGELQVTVSRSLITDVEAKVEGIEPGEFVMLAVQDTGIGMERSQLSRIFEPFYTTKEKGKGTGLGLSTVYGIVKQNRGRIQVESELGVGTCFKVYFPLVANRVEAGRAFSEIEMEPAVPKREATILVVEDEEDVRTLVQDLLETEGFNVLVAANGQEAFEIAENPDVRIDLILTDVLMPVMNGPQLVERVRQIRPQVKALFTSGYLDRSLPGYTHVHEQDFLQKPYLARTLIEAVTRALSPRRPRGRLKENVATL